MNCRDPFLSLIATALLNVGSPLFADASSLSKLNVDIGPDGSGKAAVLKEEQFPDPIIVAGSVIPIQANCTAAFECRKVGTVIGGVPVTMTSSDGKTASGSLQLKSLAGNKLILTYDGIAILQRTLTQGTAMAAGGVPSIDLAQLAVLLQNPCTTISPTSAAPRYSAADNRADVLVAVNGRVIAAPSENIDENDTMTVWLLADANLKGVLNVKRASTIRTVGSFNIVSAGSTAPDLKQNAIAFGPCEYIRFDVRDFAPGKGEVEIDATVTTSPTKIGAFEFVVDELYRGMLSFGAVSSSVVSQSFKLGTAPTATGNVIVGSESANRQLLYAVFFTPFVWGQRDIEKPVPLLHRINPVVGITTSNTSSNALLGISLDGLGFQLVGGLHYAHIATLANGYQVGSSFAGSESSIPTTLRWKGGLFLGAAIDLRAAVVLFKTLATATSSTAK
jgi:hypothetical protein